jgi:GntR family transcriptional regulator
MSHQTSAVLQARDRRPLPQQLRDRIHQTIVADGLRPGDRLPTEPVLADRFQVGRSTIREALRLLEREGLIEVQHGRGSFVSGVAQLGAERPITRFESITEMLGGLGYSEVETRVLGVHERPPSADERRELSLKRGARVIQLDRLRMSGGKPLIYSVNVLDRSLISGPLEDVEWSSSLIQLLDGLGHRVASSAAHIRATLAPPLDAELLANVSEIPWLLITETCVTSTGRPVLLAEDFQRADVFAFHIVRRRDADSQPQ